MKLVTIDPRKLKPNDWNSNVVTPENQKKLEESLKRNGYFSPIIARELEDGTLEIIGGEHRRDALIKAGKTEIEVVNLGKISDTKAKEIGLTDNERYGEDDAKALEKLLNELETANELSTFLPISDDEFDSFWTKESINLDELDLDDDDDGEPIEPPVSSAPTHRVLRFKVPVTDAERVSDFIEKTSKDNGFTASDALTNAGDALVHALKELW